MTFRHAGTGREVTVPGYFAADGDAGQSGAASGSVWRAHFSPPEAGTWSWSASFRQGEGVAVAASAKAGASGGAFDGATGSISVAPSDKDGADLRGRGLLQHDGDSYLSFAGDGGTFLKSGVGSPENFLAYSGFDNTPGSHDYRPHERHFEPGDPTWGGGEGRGIVGAVNYLADHGVNSAYMLLMNVGGDGRDVWPWAATDLDDIRKNAGDGKGSLDLTLDARAFDVSKLDQWEIVFSHMEERGIVLHLFLQETENDHLLNGGDVGTERELFMREMVARFGHHNGIIWNLGEETTNSAGQLRAHSKALKALDPYDHPVALHTYPHQHDRYEDFAGSRTLDVLSFQTSSADGLPDLDRYLGGAEKAGRPVVAFLDEPGNASVGLAAEGDKPAGRPTTTPCATRCGAPTWTAPRVRSGTSATRRPAARAATSRSRTSRRARAPTAGPRRRASSSRICRSSGWARADHLTSGTTGADHVLRGDPGEVYAVYLPQGGTATLDLGGHGGCLRRRLGTTRWAAGASWTAPSPRSLAAPRPRSVARPTSRAANGRCSSRGRAASLPRPRHPTPRRPRPPRPEPRRRPRRPRSLTAARPRSTAARATSTA